MKSKAKSIDKSFIILGIILFIVFALLAHLTPYLHDDWAWGGHTGTDRLNSFFAGYNGRYLGNLLILLIAKNRLAMIICMALSYTLACLIPCMFSGNRNALTLSLSGVLFFLLPRSIYAQTVGWASGYSNYMPPIMILALYFIMIRNIFGDEKIKYSKIAPVISLLLAFSGALFMENITLAYIAIAFLIILYVLIKAKKLYLTHIAFALGSVAGAVAMFTNSSYGIIAKSEDSYRSVPSGTDEILKTVGEHLNGAIDYLFINNLIICFIASALLVGICVICCKENKNKRAISGIIALANCFALLIFFAKSNFPEWVFVSKKFTTLLIWGAAAIYCISLLLGALICVKDKSRKFKLLLLLVTAAAVVAPLLIVNPITARCYYPPYFVICLIITEMFAALKDEISISEGSKKVLCAAFAGALIALCVFHISIYSSIHHFDSLRQEYIEKQTKNNESVVMVSTLPYKDYLWGSTPKHPMWQNHLKEHYNMNPDAKIEYIEYSEFEKFAKEYDASHK